jgi:hypothetical protein
MNGVVSRRTWRKVRCTGTLIILVLEIIPKFVDFSKERA